MRHDPWALLGRSVAVVVVFSGLYLGLMHLWIIGRDSLDAPSYVLSDRVKEFFLASVVIVLAAGVLGFRALRRYCWRKTNWRILLMTSGILMTAVGSTGMYVVLPRWGSLSDPGGLTPNFGHTLTYDNVTGPLWLVLLAGFIPYAAGYAATLRPRPVLYTVILVILLALPAYYVGYSGYIGYREFTAP